MPFSPLTYKKKTLRPMKCIVAPDFDSRTILVEDQWDYVRMWLQREGLTGAVFFWNQAKEFYKASQDLPNTSSPLTNYYSAMNATKSFLMAKGANFSPYHGLSGSRDVGKSSLTREKVRITEGGVFSALCTYLGEPSVNGTEYTLKDVLYNLPYIHRAYTLTFRSQPELFIPMKDPVFVGSPDKTVEN